MPKDVKARLLNVTERIFGHFHSKHTPDAQDCPIHLLESFRIQNEWNVCFDVSNRHLHVESIFLLFLDSIDTKTAMDRMRDLITNTNVYLDNKRKNNQIPERFILKNIAAYITKMLKVLKETRVSVVFIIIIFSCFFYCMFLKDRCLCFNTCKNMEAVLYTWTHY